MEKIIDNTMEWAEKAVDVSEDNVNKIFGYFHAAWINDEACVYTNTHRAGGPKIFRHLEVLNPTERALVALTASGFRFGDTAEILASNATIVRSDFDLLLFRLCNSVDISAFVAENESIILEDLRRLVAQVGINVAGTASGYSDTIAKITELKPDIILTGARLEEGRDGVDLAIKVREISNIPIIFITAWPELLLTGVRPEPTFLITKPFQRSTVKAALAQALFGADATRWEYARTRNDRDVGIDYWKESDNISDSINESIGYGELVQLPAPITSRVTDGRVSLDRSVELSSKIPIAVLQELANDHLYDAKRILTIQHNIGLSFDSRLNVIILIMSEPLSESSCLRLANQCRAMEKLRPAIKEAMADLTALDVIAFIDNLSLFVRQFYVWREFLAEAESNPPLSDRAQAALDVLGKIISSQKDDIIEPYLKKTIEEIEDISSSGEDGVIVKSYARSLSNIFKAIVKYLKDRAKGMGGKFNDAIDKELGEGLASGLVSLLIASSTPLLVLSTHAPTEFAWIGPLVAAVRLARR